MLKKTVKPLAHLVIGSRKFYARELSKVAATADNKVVLELGSGLKTSKGYTYSAAHIFRGCKEFIQSDIDPSFGHKIIDATTMNYKSKFDIVLAMSVFEHIFDYQTAVSNIHRSLKKDGQLVIGMPFAFPLHDEPADYWRFTEHALRGILKDFSKVEIKHQRTRIMPNGYFVIATK
jgi:SAM-dependent methyltransferase